MSQLSTVESFVKSNGFRPRLVKGHSTEQTQAYEAALLLVRHIDATLIAGTCHYRTKSGQLLRTLDEVVNAILADNLIWDTDSTAWEDELIRAA
jgi:hypothetical protein